MINGAPIGRPHCKVGKIVSHHRFHVGASACGPSDHGRKVCSWHQVPSRHSKDDQSHHWPLATAVCQTEVGGRRKLSDSLLWTSASGESVCSRRQPQQGKSLNEMLRLVGFSSQVLLACPAGFEGVNLLVNDIEVIETAKAKA